MPNSIFNNYSQYYDLIYKNKNYFKETEYIKNILIKNGLKKGSILEFGCGTGKHGILLSKSGYKVHGIDQSKKMITIAKVHQNENFSCEIGNIRKIKMNKKYDAIISLFHVMSYQTTNDQINDVFSNAAKHLKRGGLFVFDFWYTPAVYKYGPASKIKTVADDKYEITRAAKPKIYYNENRVDVLYNINIKHIQNKWSKNLKEVHSMRHFSLPELDLYSSHFSFDRLIAEEFLTGKPVSENSWSACVVLKKN